MSPVSESHAAPVVDGGPARCDAYRQASIIAESCGSAADSETTQINAGIGLSHEQIYSGT